MSEYRRRRIEPDEPRGNGGGGFPIFPLIVLVIFAGLLLGGALAKFMNRGSGPVQTPAPTFTPLPSPNASEAALTPTAKPSPTPKAVAKASPSSTPSPAATATAPASASPAPKASASTAPSPSPTPTPKPTATPKAVLVITPAPKATEKPTPKPTERPTATPTPEPALITGAATPEHAAAIVRSYLTALANGESSFATGYLRSGLPTEDFMKGGRVVNVQATPNGDGSFFVTASMTAPAGSFTENFRLENGPNGLQITSHTPSSH